jgi:thymidine kinase
MARGKLTLILSCMFAGKTELLISFARRYKIAKKRIVLVKYSNDTRYSKSAICSHNQNEFEATFSTNSLSSLNTKSEFREADVILIDEIQFFHDAPSVCDALANEGKVVIVSGLNGTYRREEFPVISKLIPLAEEFISLSAVCSYCGENAYFTKRIVSGEQTELIGGIESYQPRCRECFDK